MTKAQSASSALSGCLCVLLLGCFVVPAAINDARDLHAHLQGAPVPQCATWSITRPPCRR
jgi:hypothetical protein